MITYGKEFFMNRIRRTVRLIPKYDDFINKLMEEFKLPRSGVLDLLIDYYFFSFSTFDKIIAQLGIYFDKEFEHIDGRKNSNGGNEKKMPVQREKDPVMEEPEPEPEEKEAVKEVDDRYAFDFDTKAAEDMRKRHLKYPPPL
jgi:hypothetical protein